MDHMDRVRIAYKKLKASMFFDKTQLPLRDRIVSFETGEIDEKLSKLYEVLFGNGNWAEYEKTVLDSVGILVYPKKLVPINSDTAIFNSDSVPIEMEKPQYFIDLSVEGHILSVLWVLSVGLELDKNSDENNPNGMYEHSYGNRLRKKLINPETQDITYSPSLFEPYFSQYESWRDYGLEQAKSRLNDNQDALILTLDFKGFYYSVNLTRDNFEYFLMKVTNPQEWHHRLNDFVFKVIEKYSNMLRNIIPDGVEPNIADRNILPIGFLPSSILANWVLTPFDDAIIERWNPVYYGRYVDDIIIVDKVEKNSPLYKQARNKEKGNRLTSNEVITIFLVKSEIFSTQVSSEFKVNSSILCNTENDIGVQDKKVKLFYFQSGSTRALLNCFQTKIAQNTSEFRLMPNLDAILLHQNYSEIFDLKNEDSINKLRGVTGIELDKFALSKFLGKYRKVSGMINSNEENVFEKDLMLILDERTLIENYGTWERLFEILVVNGRIDLYEKLAQRIIDAIIRYDVPINICMKKIKTHDSLLRTLHSAISRSSALMWSKEINNTIIKTCVKVGTLRSDSRFKSASLKDFEYSAVQLTRKSYCETRMVNKYILPLPIDCILSSIQDPEEFEARLFSLEEVCTLIDKQWYDNSPMNPQYRYYPYMVAPHELSFALTYTDLNERKRNIDPKNQRNTVERLFIEWNYPLSDPEERKLYSLKKVQIKPIVDINTEKKLFATLIDSAKEDTCEQLCVAVGNARIDEKDFHNLLDKRANRSYERYQRFSQMFDAAVKEKVKLLVLPENYLPFEWLPIIARMCAGNQMAVVTGIEHILVPGEADKPGQVYNLTAVILPFEQDGYKFANISYHNKVEYSPNEKKQIEGHGYSYQPGNTYQIFCWRDVWFPVYCCYELASIQDKALFQSYSDLTVAVEWNRDVPYFSNIIESLARDLHCYCIQANSSDYGDSRVISPTETLSRDIIRTKGGKNSCILSDTIDIKALRDFQMLGHNLQSDIRSFKQTPPGFNKTILEKKRDGELYDYIKSHKSEED